MIEGGFADPVLSAQSTFRAVLKAMAGPGRAQPLETKLAAPAPLSSAAAAVALTLCDRDTPVWLDGQLRAADAVAAWLRFHCGAKIVEQPASAAFAFVADARTLPAFERFNLGTIDYPDRSTTIVLQVHSLAAGGEFILTGPGIRGRHAFRASQLPPDMPQRLAANHTLFPRGVDLILASADEIAALPRSVRLLSSEEARACT